MRDIDDRISLVPDSEVEPVDLDLAVAQFLLKLVRSEDLLDATSAQESTSPSEDVIRST